jgi:hypothetical protein
MVTPTEFAGVGEVILNPLNVTPLISEPIVTAPDTTASLTLTAAVPGAIELFGPKIVSALSILTFSVYVPAQTLMVSLAVAAVTASWIVEYWPPPVAHTSIVAADATDILPAVRVVATSETVSKLLKTRMSNSINL